MDKIIELEILTLYKIFKESKYKEIDAINKYETKIGHDALMRYIDILVKSEKLAKVEYTNSVNEITSYVITDIGKNRINKITDLIENKKRKQLRKRWFNRNNYEIPRYIITTLIAIVALIIALHNKHCLCTK